VRFNGWPELKESFISGNMPATFMLAPMAMALREQGVPVKIVYLGHRDGSALMVRKDSDIRNMIGLRGKRVAVPNRFSNQYLMINKALRDNGMTAKDIILLEMPPPDMPAALYQAKELWPNFISCVLVVDETFIRDHPDKVQEMVTGIARSGLWLDQSMDHRMKAAKAVAENYYNQDPRLLSFVLSKPPDRVSYTKLRLAREDFKLIEELALEAEILKNPLPYESYTDARFSENTTGVGPYPWEAN